MCRKSWDLQKLSPETKELEGTSFLALPKPSQMLTQTVQTLSIYLSSTMCLTPVLPHPKHPGRGSSKVAPTPPDLAGSPGKAGASPK